MSRKKIEEALAHIFRGIGPTNRVYEPSIYNRRSACRRYWRNHCGDGIRQHDGKTSDGRLVQVKATFQDQLTFRKTPELYLGFKLYPDGGHEVIFNGPGHIIFDEYRNRKGIGVNLLRFPNSRLKELSANIPHRERERERESLHCCRL
jgi:hypothetical protein